MRQLRAKQIETCVVTLGGRYGPPIDVLHLYALGEDGVVYYHVPPTDDTPSRWVPYNMTVEEETNDVTH